MESESQAGNEISIDIRKRVTIARERQYARFGKEVCNANVSNEQLLACSQLNEEQQKMMQQWTSKYNWSTRVQMKILRLSRTISDLSGSKKITNESIWEAVTMRRSQTGKIKKEMIK